MSEPFPSDYIMEELACPSESPDITFTKQVASYVVGMHEELPQINSATEARLAQNALRLITSDPNNIHDQRGVSRIEKNETMKTRFKEVNENITNVGSPGYRRLKYDLTKHRTSTQPLDESWKDSAACKGMDVEIFYDSDSTESIEAALKACKACEVRAECREYAKKANIEWGIWAENLKVPDGKIPKIFISIKEKLEKDQE